MVTVPGGAAPVELDASDVGFDVTNPHSQPATIEPTQLGFGSSFADGVYRFQVTYHLGTNVAETYEFDERWLHIPGIEACLKKTYDDYMHTVCDKCSNRTLLRKAQELTVLRATAQIDIQNGEYVSAANKVTLMANICAGAECSCVCGC